MFDKEAAARLIEQVADKVRPLGLTLIPEGSAFQNQGDDIILISAFLIRESALDEDTDDEASAAFNEMMRQEHEQTVRTIQDGAKAILSGDLDALFDDEVEESDDEACLHEHKHPSGFCLDCSAGLEGEGLAGV